MELLHFTCLFCRRNKKTSRLDPLGQFPRFGGVPVSGIPFGSCKCWVWRSSRHDFQPRCCPKKLIPAYHPFSYLFVCHLWWCGFSEPLVRSHLNLLGQKFTPKTKLANQTPVPTAEMKWYNYKPDGWMRFVLNCCLLQIPCFAGLFPQQKRWNALPKPGLSRPTWKNLLVKIKLVHLLHFVGVNNQKKQIPQTIWNQLTLQGSSNISLFRLYAFLNKHSFRLSLLLGYVIYVFICAFPVGYMKSTFSACSAPRSALTAAAGGLTSPMKGKGHDLNQTNLHDFMFQPLIFRGV